MVQFGGNVEASVVLRPTDRVQHQVEASKWLPSPVVSYGAKEPMLNVVPFRSSARVVANCDRNIVFICPSLKLSLPKPRSVSVTAPAVSCDQQLGGIRVLLSPPTLPPTLNGTHRKLRRIGRYPNGDMPSLLGYVVNPVWNRSAFCIAWKIVRRYFVGFLPPQLSVVLEFTNQFRVLGVHADRRQVFSEEPPFLSLNVAILPIAIWMWRSRQPFDVGTQRVSEFPQQSADSAVRDDFHAFRKPS